MPYFRPDSARPSGAVSEGATTRWLPVDTILKTDGARATDAALIPLATEAQRIRRVTVWGASLLCVLAMALALGSETAGGWGVAGVAVAAVAFAIVLQKQKLWVEAV